MNTTAHPALHHRHVSRTTLGLILGALVAVAAFVASPYVFTPAPEAPEPTGMQLTLFILLTAIDAVVFGLGVLVAVACRPLIAPLFSTPARTTAVHLSLTWLLASWWLHDGLHLVVGMHLDHLLLIEYGFHVTLMTAAAVVVWALTREARSRRR